MHGIFYGSAFGARLVRSFRLLNFTKFLPTAFALQFLYKYAAIDPHPKMAAHAATYYVFQVGMAMPTPAIHAEIQFVSTAGAPEHGSGG